MKKIKVIGICDNGQSKETEVSIEDFCKKVKKALSDKRSSAVREKV